MSEEYYERIRQQAAKQRVNRDFTAAGDSYSKAAYHVLSRDAFDEWNVWHGMDHLRYAIVCYRLAEDQIRCINRAQQGILFVEEIQTTRLSTESVDIKQGRTAITGLGYEYIGDYRTIAGLEDRDEAYRAAIERYETVETTEPSLSVMGWTGEFCFESGIDFLLRLLDVLDEDIDMETYRDFRSRSLTRRIEYREAYLDSLLSRLDNHGEFEWSDEARSPPE